MTDAQWDQVHDAYVECRSGPSEPPQSITDGLKAAFAKAEELGMVTMVSPEEIQKEKEWELARDIAETLARGLDTDGSGYYICYDFDWAAGDLRQNYPWFEEAFVRAASGESAPFAFPELPDGWALTYLGRVGVFSQHFPQGSYRCEVQRKDGLVSPAYGDTPEEAYLNAIDRAKEPR